MQDIKKKIHTIDWQKIKILTLLSLVLSLDGADKATVSAVAGELIDFFGIGYTDMGLLVSAVAFSTTLLTLPFGILVDRINRKRLLMAVIVLWGLATILSGAATSYIFLVVMQILLGVVTAVAYPGVASMTGDFFHARERVRMFGFILAGELVGTGFGFFICSQIAAVSSWRWPFFLMGILSGVLVLLVWRYLPEPPRGKEEWISDREESSAVKKAMLRSGIKPREHMVLQEDPVNKSVWWAIKYVVRIPTFMLLIVASSLVYFFFSGIRVFSMVFLPHHFREPYQVISALLVIPGFGAVAGMIASGYFTEWLFKRHWFNARIIVPAVSIAIGAFAYAPGLWTTNIYLGLSLITVAIFFTAASSPPISAARLDILHPRLWGRGEGVRMAIKSIAEGGGPLIFGVVAEYFGGDTGLLWTYLIMLIPFLCASLIAFPACYTYPRDVVTAAKSFDNTRQKNGRGGIRTHGTFIT